MKTPWGARVNDPILAWSFVGTFAHLFLKKTLQNLKWHPCLEYLYDQCWCCMCYYKYLCKIYLIKQAIYQLNLFVWSPIVKSNALSFYRSQNVLCWSKFFELVQKFIYILCQSQTFCARQKDDLHSVKLVFVPAQKVLKRH